MKKFLLITLASILTLVFIIFSCIVYYDEYVWPYENKRILKFVDRDVFLKLKLMKSYSENHLSIVRSMKGNKTRHYFHYETSLKTIDKITEKIPKIKLSKTIKLPYDSEKKPKWWMTQDFEPTHAYEIIGCFSGVKIIYKKELDRAIVYHYVAEPAPGLLVNCF